MMDDPLFLRQNTGLIDFKTQEQMFEGVANDIDEISGSYLGA